MSDNAVITTQIITQTTGDGLSVTLLHPSELPERGVGEGGTQRTIVTLYPKARDASMQVLGPREAPIRLEGRILDTDLGAGAVAKFHATMTRIRTDGFAVRLEWGDIWDKYGVVREYTPTWFDPGYLRYSIEIEVIQDAKLTRTAGYQTAQQASLTEAVAIAQAKAKATPRSISGGVWMSVFAHIQTSNLTAKTAVDAAVTMPTITAIDEGNMAIADMRARLDVADVMDFATGVGPTKAGHALDLVLWERDTRTAFTALQGALHDLHDALVTASLGTPMRSVVVRRGDTLFTLAGRAHGDWSRWGDIAQLNGIIPTAALVPGQMLLIPN